MYKQFSLAVKFSLLCSNVTLPAALEQTVASERNVDDIMLRPKGISQYKLVILA